MKELTLDVSAADFDRTTVPSAIEGRPGEFAVELDPGWASLAGVHGGYMSAITVRAAELCVPGRPVRTVSTGFLRPGQVGAAELEVRTVRDGRSFTTLLVDLRQDGRPVLTSRITMMAERSGAEWSDKVEPDLPPPAECVPFEFPAAVINAARVESGFDPDRLPFDPERALVRGWIRPLEARPIDAGWLAMAVDWFPPPAFSRADAPVGGVSIDLVTHIHRADIVLDSDEWLAGSFEVPTSSDGLAVEQGRITTMDGTVVAESFQTRLTAQG